MKELGQLEWNQLDALLGKAYECLAETTNVEKIEEARSLIAEANSMRATMAIHWRRSVQQGDDPCGVKRMQTAAEVWHNYCDRTAEQKEGDL